MEEGDSQTNMDQKQENDKRKKRSPNFSEQDCILLCQLLEQKHSEEKFQKLGLTNHQLIKHRFTDGITSEVKRTTWRRISSSFNAIASVNRSISDLEKKWDNLVAKHRAIYADYKREIKITGGGPGPKPLSVLTDAVMDVIGKENVSVEGAATFLFDTTMLTAIQHETATLDQTTPVQTPSTSQATDNDQQTQQQMVTHKRSCCSFDDELLELKKKKLNLQIKVLEKQLKE